MAPSRSSVTKMSRERPARFSTVALVSPLGERTLSRLCHEHGRIVCRARPPGQYSLR
jgi:hypothetical protein